MKQHLSAIKNPHKKTSCIDEMDALLDQIVDFKKLINTTKNISDPRLKQEYRLFKQHVEWVIEDLNAGNYIVSPKKNNSDTKLTG